MCWDVSKHARTDPHCSSAILIVQAKQSRPHPINGYFPTHQSISLEDSVPGAEAGARWPFLFGGLGICSSDLPFPSNLLYTTMVGNPKDVSILPPPDSISLIFGYEILLLMGSRPRHRVNGLWIGKKGLSFDPPPPPQPVASLPPSFLKRNNPKRLSLGTPTASPLPY